MLKFKNPADQSSNMAATGPSFELKPYAYCRDRQPFGETFVGLALDINLYFRPTKSPRDIILAQRPRIPGAQRLISIAKINGIIRSTLIVSLAICRFSRSNFYKKVPNTSQTRDFGDIRSCCRARHPRCSGMARHRVCRPGFQVLRFRSD
jgi:hypothetical protein